MARIACRRKRRRPNVQTLRFTRAMRPYRAGEVAGFGRDAAAAYVAGGVAVEASAAEMQALRDRPPTPGLPPAPRTITGEPKRAK